MRAFAALYRALDASTSLLAKREAMRHYFREIGGARPADAAWAVYFLSGGRPRQMAPTALLKQVTRELAGLPEWLFDECYESVGDLAETIALLLPAGGEGRSRGLADTLEQDLLPLRGLEPPALATRLRELLRHTVPAERLVYLKLITGAFRVGVSRQAVTQALALECGVDARLIAQRLVGRMGIGTTPGADDWHALVDPEGAADALGDGPGQRDGRPYPFFLAHALTAPPDTFDALLGPPADWQVEWKWDGIRAQLVRRGGQVWVWSRGEELMAGRFPEIEQVGQRLPDGTVLDGEILVWQASGSGEASRAEAGVGEAGAGEAGAGRARPFSDLQRRIGRKTLSARLLAELPVMFLAYDLLEQQGQDMRGMALSERRARLETLVAGLDDTALPISPLLPAGSWAELAQAHARSRQLGVEGLMLKQRSAHYGIGRTKAVGTWWKWKVDPMSVDAVLIYAQRGHGRRASLYTDYTFAVWDGPAERADRQLVPFAKAYSGLTDAEIAQVDAIVRRTTVESFGPVRSVSPTLVFELGFEGIARSSRHRSGIAVRFPRMLRWRLDKPVAEADTLAQLAALLPAAADLPDMALNAASMAAPDD